MVRFLFGLLVVFMFAGCTSQISSLSIFDNSKINDEESMKYEKKYLSDFEKIKKESTSKKDIFNKWIQAFNKKEDCKIYVGYNPNDDRTQKIDYKIYWDGECKDGYAYGLGREFEKGLMTDLEAIAVYSGGRTEPKYYYQYDKLSNITYEGELYKYYTEKRIKDDGVNLKVEFIINYADEQNLVQYSFINRPLEYKTYYKSHPNFAYAFNDFSKNPFDKRKNEFNYIDASTGKVNGFTAMQLKSDETIGIEIINHKPVRNIKLPGSYYNHIGEIYAEIIDKLKFAKQKIDEAKILKKQYKNRICKDGVNVSFINNKEYREICFEEQKNAELQKKINEKFAKIKKELEEQKEKEYQERLVTAREQEAEAAQKNARAAEISNFNQSMQNIGNNLQMQQLNNNLMLNNFLKWRNK
jgi:hypothetical protein